MKQSILKCEKWYDYNVQYVARNDTFEGSELDSWLRGY